MKKIVVAADLSERSDRAIERGLSLASASGATCTVVSIVDDANPKGLASQIRKSTEKQLRLTLDSHGGKAAGLDVRVGDIAAGVLGLTLEHDADLLVLGLHRPRSFMDAVRETTMERIVALSRLPVLLVREPVNAPYARVLVPVSFSRECAAAVMSARAVAPNAVLSVFHALHVPFAGILGGLGSDMEKWSRNEAEDEALAWHAKYGMSGELPEVVTGGIFQVLESKMQSDEPDLLAIGAHTRSGLGFHRLGALASGLIRNPPTDLLVARS